MSTFILIFLSWISTWRGGGATEQAPDLLIIGNDTLYLSTFPLEQLQFEIRPFKYGHFYFPNSGCWRGYQATWKVVENKLLLTEIARADITREKIDVFQYFHTNNYTPTVYNGLIFADWFTSDLTTYKRDFPRYDCNFKGWRKKRYRPALRFESGVMTMRNLRRL